MHSHIIKSTLNDPVVSIVVVSICHLSFDVWTVILVIQQLHHHRSSTCLTLSLDINNRFNKFIKFGGISEMPGSAGLKFTFALHYKNFPLDFLEMIFNVSKPYANSNALYIIGSSSPFLL